MPARTRSAFYVYVTDVEATYRRALEAGARSIQGPSDAVHGDRMATVVDEFGNQWTIAIESNKSPWKSCIDDWHRASGLGF